MELNFSYVQKLGPGVHTGQIFEWRVPFRGSFCVRLGSAVSLAFVSSIVMTKQATLTILFSASLVPDMLI